MKPYKKVYHDVYDIAHRLEKIDSRYSVRYDEDRHLYFLFELDSCSLCLGKALDKMSIDLVYLSHVRNKYKIFDSIDNDNKLLEKKNMETISRQSNAELKDYIDYADRKGGNIDFSRCNSTFWL